MTPPPRRTVLVVEDDHDTRVALRESLEEEGFSVVSATNGKDAFEVLDSIPAPAAIVLDIWMPIMNGDDFLKELKVKPELAKIPVIQISANNEIKRDQVEYAFRKPILYEALLSTVARCVNRGSFQSLAS